MKKEKLYRYTLEVNGERITNETCSTSKKQVVSDIKANYKDAKKIVVVEIDNKEEEILKIDITNNDNDNDVFLVLFDYEKENDFSVLKPITDKVQEHILNISLIEEIGNKIVEFKVIGEKIADMILDYAHSKGLSSGVVALPND